MNFSRAGGDGFSLSAKILRGMAGLYVNTKAAKKKFGLADGWAGGGVLVT
jgi:hypothetical protein